MYFLLCTYIEDNLVLHLFISVLYKNILYRTRQEKNFKIEELPVITNQVPPDISPGYTRTIATTIKLIWFVPFICMSTYFAMFLFEPLGDRKLPYYLPDFCHTHLLHSLFNHIIIIFIRIHFKCKYYYYYSYNVNLYMEL